MFQNTTNSNNNNQQQQQLSSSSSSSTTNPSKLKCAQLQLPGHQEIRSAGFINNESHSNSSAVGGEQKPVTGLTSSILKEQREFFEENVDKLKNYMDLMNRHQIPIKSFSTSDIAAQSTQLIESSSPPPTLWHKKYLSDCDLADYYKYNNANEKGCIKDYITYSCSTLAICGDTIHSSQLPSPQAQSHRQLNSIIFSDFDLAKSLNKKLINFCIKKRIMEFTKVIRQSTLSQSEIDDITKISSGVIIKPLKVNYDFQPEEYSTGEIFINVVNYEQNEMKFTKQDKEKFVLNWLQTVVEPGVIEPN